MFAIVISEKGGAERREVFDRTELTIGRVQGNDLTLPKGNVSKRHARLLCRDGRFIVTDLNSTNGTYVNRRRISQATIVREGDRIFVGDFVLRLELPEPGADFGLGGTDRNVSGNHRSVPNVESLSLVPVAEALDEASSPLPVSRPPAVPLVVTPPRPAPAASRASRDSVVEAPPFLTEAMPLPPEAARATLQSPVHKPRISVAPEPDSRSRRASVEKVVERVMAALEPGALDANSSPRIERLVDDHVAELRSGGALAPSLAERVALDAKAELTGIGPLAGLLEDDSVTEVVVSRWDRVTATRSGQVIAVDAAFTSEDALRRAIGRLCRRSGVPLEVGDVVVERRLPDGTMLWAAVGAATQNGSVLLVRKARRVSVSFDDLVRSGVASRSMATFLQYCVEARVNLLVVGPRDEGTAGLLGALCAAGSNEQLVVVEDADDLGPGLPDAMRFSVAGLGFERIRLVNMASRIPNVRLLVELGTHEITEATLEAVTGGAAGVIGVVRSSSLRRALARLPADVLASRPGMTSLAAREQVAAAFDIAIELVRTRDGRHRILRVSELGGVAGEDFLTQEIFSFMAERTGPGSAIEGSFNPSGSLPRVIDELQARGVAVDLSIFSRPAR